MSEPIKVGDWVMVVRPGCCDEYLGLVFKVAAIRQIARACRSCGNYHIGKFGDPMACEDGERDGFEFPRLRKLPGITDDVKRDEEITA